MAAIQFLLAGACALGLSGCGTFGDDFDDVIPETADESMKEIEADAGRDSDRDSDTQ